MSRQCRLLVAVAISLMLVASSLAKPVPIALMHGISGQASDMNEMISWIQAAIPGVYARSIEVGDGGHDSWWLPLNTQVDMFCAAIRNDTNFADGFNLIGYSQGGLITRGYIERCNDPPVRHWISIVGPHGGQFGIPSWNQPWIDALIQSAPYDSWLQNHVSFATYWKDPYRMSEYLEKSGYLADVNNERAEKNAMYKENILSLESATLVKSLVDDVICPPESEWFEFYAEGTQKSITPLAESKFWIEDYLGFRALNESGRLHFQTTTSRHQDITNDKFKPDFEAYVLPILELDA